MSKNSQFAFELYGYSGHRSWYRDQPMPYELVTFKGHDGRNMNTKDTVQKTMIIYLSSVQGAWNNNQLFSHLKKVFLYICGNVRRLLIFSNVLTGFGTMGGATSTFCSPHWWIRVACSFLTIFCLEIKYNPCWNYCPVNSKLRAKVG